jgi:flavin reductase (DIM6/NTAB) family NADH-FMN oxidoreductase RutF
MSHNKHPEFKSVENSRPDWHADRSPTYTKVKDPNWKIGSGENSHQFPIIPPTSSSSTEPDKQKQEQAQSQEKNEYKHITIDPYSEGRPTPLNYKLLISAIIPRPIGFLSTASADRKSTNVAPYSFFQMISYDPPLFIFGFSSSLSSPKDSLKNLLETGEGVINIISEHFIEAANCASIDAPQGASEFDLTGLTPVFDTEVVKAPRVKEAVFSIEVKLVETREYFGKYDTQKKKGNSVLAVVEGVRFWARSDAVNEDGSYLDPSVCLFRFFSFLPSLFLGGVR